MHPDDRTDAVAMAMSPRTAIMDKREARQVLRRVNELHFDLELLREKEDELQQKIKLLKHADYPVGLVHADFLEECGRYVFIDDLTR